MSSASAGREGEDRAARLLEAAGMRILARNFRSGRGEIDLIALDGSTIVFVEVKSWRAFGAEDLGIAVGPRKIRRIVETAKIFLDRNREYYGAAVRFDLVFIDAAGARHLASAFTERV